MKNVKRIIAILLAVMTLAAMLAACGDSSKEEEKNNNTAASASQTDPQNDPEDETQDETQGDGPGVVEDDVEITGQGAEWGDYSFLIPDGFTLKEADEFSPYDFAVEKSSFSYFYFNTEADDENMMQHYNYNKATYTNEQVDFEYVYGDNTWTGFQYSDGWGGYGFEAYTTIDGKIVRVSSAGYQYDSAVAVFVLESLAKK